MNRSLRLGGKDLYLDSRITLSATADDGMVHDVSVSQAAQVRELLMERDSASAEREEAEGVVSYEVKAEEGGVHIRFEHIPEGAQILYRIHGQVHKGFLQAGDEILPDPGTPVILLLPNQAPILLDMRSNGTHTLHTERHHEEKPEVAEEKEGREDEEEDSAEEARKKAEEQAELLGEELRRHEEEAHHRAVHARESHDEGHGIAEHGTKHHKSFGDPLDLHEFVSLDIGVPHMHEHGGHRTAHDAHAAPEYIHTESHAEEQGPSRVHAAPHSPERSAIGFRHERGEDAPRGDRSSPRLTNPDTHAARVSIGAAFIALLALQEAQGSGPESPSNIHARTFQERNSCASSPKRRRWNIRGRLW